MVPRHATALAQNAMGCTDLILFSTVRNEASRLPFFLNYYSARGVAQFVIVDNGSTDGTTELLASRSNVHLIRTKKSYAEANYGIEWIQTLVHRYGYGRWCLVVDADEILVYPGWEQLSLPEVCLFLEAEGASAMYSVLLDMYSDVAFRAIPFEHDADPVTVSPYYEIASIRKTGYMPIAYGSTPKHRGGMRARVFGLTNVCLDKVVLLKPSPSLRLEAGMHALAHARFSKMQGAVLHFKYMSDFADRASLEARRGEHWNCASEYKRYHDRLASASDLSPYDASTSLRFNGSAGLLQCGILKMVPAFRTYIASANPAVKR